VDQEAARSVSRGVFGNKHKLEIIVAIAAILADGEGDFYPRMISKLVPDAADNQVGKVIRQLHCAGLLIPVTDKADLQKHRFRARESNVWELAQSLLTELRSASWDPPEES
jgi:hypothetical protein